MNRVGEYDSHETVHVDQATIPRSVMLKAYGLPRLVIGQVGGLQIVSVPRWFLEEHDLTEITSDGMEW